MILLEQHFATDSDIINFRSSYARALKEYEILQRLWEGSALTDDAADYYRDLKAWLNKYMDKYVEICGSILG